MWERTSVIERAQDDGPGVVRGTLVTNAEASDGHILDVLGMEATAPAPMLFGHDDFSGERNLGSWANFTKRGNKMSKLGDQSLLAAGQIELGGTGDRADWRADMAHMIDAGHVGALSVRWADGKTPPVRRVNLPSDHPAFVDDSKATGAQRWGLFFESSRLLEGSVVTIGADPGALMHCYRGAEGAERELWKYAMRDAGPIDTMPRDELETHFGAILRHLAEMPAFPALEDEPDPTVLAQILERIELIDERLDDLTIDTGRVPADPPTAPERVEDAAPLAALSPKLQALAMLETRGDEFSPLKVVRDMLAGIKADREEMHARFLAKVEEMRGRV